MRKTIYILLLILMGLLIFGLHIMSSTGFFREIDPHFEGQILMKIPVKGAEDITISRTDSFAIISSTHRKSIPANADEKGALYFLSLKDSSFSPVNLTSNLEFPFAPHGISLLKLDSSYQLMAINHTSNGHSIEVFTLKDSVLSHQFSMTDASMVSPNDLVLYEENKFYFTNDHGYANGIGKLLEEYGGLAVSNVIHFDGTSYSEAADGIAYANGINIDVHRNLLFVASPRGFLTKVYQINEDKSLTHIEDIGCHTGVDNIEFDEKGNLWIGGHPNLLRFSAYAKGKRETAPSEIIKIEYRSKGDYTVNSVYLEDGRNMSGCSVATKWNDLILTGNVMDDNFLILQSKN